MVQRSHLDVLVIGTASVDIVFGGMPHWPKLGQEMYVKEFAVGVGSVFNTASTLSRLGLRVGLMTELGNDFFSRYILEEIDKAGICRDFVTINDFPMRTVSICLAHEGERGFVSYVDGHTVMHMADSPASGHNIESEEGAKRWKDRWQQQLREYDIDAVFLYVHPYIHPLLDLFVDRDISIFLDAGWHPEELADERLTEVIKRGHVLMPNQMEAMFMTGTQTAEEAALALAQWVPTAIVKAGARGVVACKNGEIAYCPAFPIKEVVDTTGAGDAFDGGFIYGSLKGYSFMEALRCGTICGSLSTTAPTGTAAVPNAQELEECLQKAF
ncbi:carbohydrate kinase family protein [Ktedonosporobacter rubrisoli]|uniref:Carbohydrate kinase family protein n=1 Tax=Ktedonosporobacter rubrisoli TaxID=2509675 RepID=A0A4P6K648_KTERU|nr:carbohydrate kinase family protein [Ktedonosporobacter rubrisoli]QBD83046.1 carbohydrate kinase family protein [Ktedonosporobacter rubrisoli]